VRVEAVTVSVGYGDLLAQTLPENLPLLDHIVVATAPDDEETREVCRRHSVHCILSEDHKRGGDFNKGRLIQRIFDQVNGRGWVLHLDSDIVLPRKFSDYLDWADLDDRVIYGADRCNLMGYDRWQSLKINHGFWDNHTHESSFWFHGSAPTGSRWVSKLHGYVPIGAFQLFHGNAAIDKGMHVRRYPYHHQDCARADIQFALQWDRRYRQILPEVILLHLESEPCKIGSNWNGRQTKRFGPPLSSKPDYHLADY
jgi:hypothetical protein